MSDMNKVAIQINGVKYPITTAESPAYVEELGREMDKTVRQIMGSANLSINEALVLLALSYLDQYHKAESGADNLRNQVAQYLDEASKARQDTTEAFREIERLEEQIKQQENRKDRGKA